MPRLDHPPLRLPTALQPVGCEHPRAVAMGTLSEPYVYRCVNPNCNAEWQETDWRRQVWW